MDTDRLIKRPADYAEGVSLEEYRSAVVDLMAVARQRLQEESENTKPPDASWAGDFGMHYSYLLNEEQSVLFNVIYLGDRFEEAHHLFVITMTPTDRSKEENFVFSFAFANMQDYPGLVARDFGRFTLEGLREVKDALSAATHIDKAKFDSLTTNSKSYPRFGSLNFEMPEI